MSSGVDRQQASGVWSYFGFNSHSGPSTTRNRRTSSVSLPTRNLDSFGRSDRYQRNINAARHGHGNDTHSWMNSRQLSRYLKVGGVITLIVFVLFYLSPGEREVVEKYVGEHTPFRSGNQPASGNQPIPADQPKSGNQLVPDKKPFSDTASTAVGSTRCTKPFASHKPLIQYVLMIDAGSTGSRIHVYRFNNCGSTPELEDEIFKQTVPREGGSGLSSYKEDAEGAAKSLDILMDEAMKNVPDNLKSCTPVAVKATAGLRKLGPELSDRILKAVRKRLETQYPFPVVSEEKGGVEVMEGKYEGVYAWITTNYLLGKIGGPDESPTAAVFDLGGGSTQIVFEPNFKKPGGGMPEKLAEGDHKYELDFGGRKFELYQHSYLGYGLMAARNNIHVTVLDAVHKEKGSTDSTWLSKPIPHPCIIPGMSKEINVELPDAHPLGPKVKVKVEGPAVGAPVQCQAIAEKTLRKDAECKLHPCAFDGVHQPSLEKTFAREDVFLFSYFYDRIKPLGVPESFTLRELKELANRVCQGKSAWDVFHGVDGALAELNGRPETCLDLNFMFSVLHTGYEMPLDREVKIAKKIKGNELGWCLGASLPLLEQSSGWHCRIKETT